ncbi:hypothetical protein PsAD5_00133 [Pseudovibrio sp. Ad5]|uniref:hypothetical protein n=1 Tax=Pseudovibrio sp. Ad5 TaxID=989436 RepID=UPI0007AEB09D|nr:hypothetical protein [Pseudovibrio sp. Ad5]KZL02184.1 hypothetical protein PsAD5_00133 [Pseudovibrio sp. Ad5]
MNDLKKQQLSERLVRLGGMIGDGLHLEPDGKWITREYRSTLKALGIKRLRANNSAEINEFMQAQVEALTCSKCEGELKQTRSGSLRAACTNCGARFVVGKRRRRKAKA